MKIAVIGGGNMGGALARAVIAARVAGADELLLVEQNAKRGATLAAELRCAVRPSIEEGLRGYDALVLAVKPQDAGKACEAVRSFLRAEQLVLSVMAGITIESLRQQLGGHRNLVRSMPNMPLQVGQGMTVFVTAPELPEKLRAAARRLLESGGAAVQVEQEELLNAATAVSGCGPGYAFYILNELCRAAETLGFSQEQSALLVRQSWLGALTLWEQSKESLAVLCGRVASKGGSTEAALRVFSELGLARALHEGVLAADKRAGELSRG